MSKIKRALIVTLLCANVALVAALVLVAAAPPAEGQIIGAGVDYLVVAGRMSKEQAGLYVVDLAQHAMVVWDFDKTGKKLRVVDGRSLRNDFRAQGGRVGNP